MVADTLSSGVSLPPASFIALKLIVIKLAIKSIVLHVLNNFKVLWCMPDA
jgi:hypothetical protein